MRLYTTSLDNRGASLHLTPIMVGLISLCFACSETLIVDTPMDDMEMSLDESIEPPQERVSPEQAAEGSLLLRVLPSELEGEAEVYCEGVAIAEQLVLTTAHCFDRGASFVEAYSGSTIDIKDPQATRIPATKVYLNPSYQSGTPLAVINDIAVVFLKEATSSQILKPISALNEIQSTFFIRLGYEVIDTGKFQRILNPSDAIEFTPLEVIFGDPLAPACLLGGGPVVTSYQEMSVLAAINTRGTGTCIEGGAALRVDSHRGFIESTLSAADEANILTSSLSCAQSFYCQSPECFQSLSETAKPLFDALFTCANERGCNTPNCYATQCPEEHQACVSAR